jgi:transcriptional regulator with XRE-family HTH domain
MNDSIDYLQSDLGKRVRQLRLFRNVDQRTIAERAGISLRALGKLENGRGSTLETLLRTLKALDYVQGIEMLAPEVTVNPIAMLGTPRPPQRVRRPRKLRKANES